MKLIEKLILDSKKFFANKSFLARLGIIMVRFISSFLLSFYRFSSSISKKMKRKTCLHGNSIACEMTVTS